MVPPVLGDDAYDGPLDRLVDEPIVLGYSGGMPMIDYTCKLCQHTFSRLVLRGEDERPEVCPQCNNPRVLPARAPAGLFDGVAPFSSLAKDTN